MTKSKNFFRPKPAQTRVHTVGPQKNGQHCILLHDQLGFQQHEGYTNPRNLQTVQKTKKGHEQDCKKINELNIAAHDRFANFLERILRKRYQARKVCKDNDNRLEDRIKPDISIVVNGVQIYLDIGITWDLFKYYALKEQHFRDQKDQNGRTPVNFETIYEVIGYMISTSQTHRAELMYKESSPTGRKTSLITFTKKE
ncbi:Hypothetical_protein [Hexamita inflata]|uniref:Hypothetical_protein n=1 Tax=Hexamita inflata TaxID=28002 RepID=A0AA86N7P8_9EUKA|nr:Hypothetical protein HINF_LOCUS2062 [Hexamita inflata]